MTFQTQNPKIFKTVISLLCTFVLFFFFAFPFSDSFTFSAHAQTLTRLGVVGDSSEDEYRAEDNRAGGTQWETTTLSWTELLHEKGKL